MTAFGLACGLFVIFRACLADIQVEKLEVFKMTATLLFLASISDVLDGLLARRLKAESDFGFQFDSLADAITFGVAPSVVILKTLSLDLQSSLGLWVIFASMVYSICAVLRLVRFNISEMEKEKLAYPDADKHFTGLPVPAAALAAISTNWFLSPEFSSTGQVFNFTLGLSVFQHAAILIVSMCLLGYLMVCRLKFPSIKTLNFKVPKFHLAFTTVLFAWLILYGIFYQFPMMMCLLSWLYICCAVSFAIFRRFSGKSSHLLKDFDPEDN